MLSQRGKKLTTNSCEQGLGIGCHQTSQQQYRKLEFSVMMLLKSCNFPCRILYPSQLLMIKSEGRIETLWTCKITNLPPMHPFEEAAEGCSPSKQENKPVKMKTCIQKTGNPKQKRDEENLLFEEGKTQMTVYNRFREQNSLG